MNPLVLLAIAFFLTSGSMSGTTTAMVVIGLLIYMVGSLVKNQESLLYQPSVKGISKPSENPEGFRSPRDLGLPYENCYISSMDKVLLHAWFVRPRDPAEVLKRPTVLFLHANAGNMGFRLPNLHQLYHELGLNILIVSYRGYGESSGTPSEEGLIADAEAAFVWLQKHEHVNTKQIIIFGRSLGGAVAIALAHKYPRDYAALVLENTFTNIPDMVDKIFWFIRPIKEQVLRLSWQSIERIQALEGQVLFLSALSDEVVPAEHMWRLYSNAHNARYKVLKQFKEGTHNDLWLKSNTAYFKAFGTFLTETLADYTPSLLPGTGRPDMPSLRDGPTIVPSSSSSAKSRSTDASRPSASRMDDEID